jgi:hypothetical protein
MIKKGLGFMDRERELSRNWVLWVGVELLRNYLRLAIGCFRMSMTLDEVVLILIDFLSEFQRIP